MDKTEERVGHALKGGRDIARENSQSVSLKKKVSRKGYPEKDKK